MRKAVTGRKVGLLIRAPTCESRRNTQHEMHSRDRRLEWQDWSRFNSASEKRAMLCHCLSVDMQVPDTFDRGSQMWGNSPTLEGNFQTNWGVGLATRSLEPL